MSETMKLIVFTRYPSPGEVKTRLIGTLGRIGAASLHQQMTQHILERVRDLAALGIAVEVHFAGGTKTLMARMFSNDCSFYRQKGAGLGERMLYSFSRSFDRGATRVVLIGTDCPGITRGTILTAFDLLGENDCVFGPADDGGYYLIGLKKPVPQLFENIPWGEGSTLHKSLEAARLHGLSYALLERLRDVDRPEDLVVWDEVKAAKALQMISIIIPVLNEEAHIARTIRSLQTAKNSEIIVVDGGSRDATVDTAFSCGVRVIQCRQGRAAQMNHGARHASGEILLFIHGDTVVPEGYDREIREPLRDEDVAGGAFSLRFDSPEQAMRIIEMGANLRSRYLGLPYGDQGLFVFSVVFKNLGGFPDMAIMEDVAFVRQLQRQGKFVTLDAAVTTSARRYEAIGPFQTWVMNQCVLAAYALDVSPDRIAGLYRSRCKGMKQWFSVVISGLKSRCVRSLH